jgi:drug/metabolite transporter (DMT)-like permease
LTEDNAPREGQRASAASEDSAPKKYALAVIEALLVTVLWSSSWVIIKFGLKDIPPLTFSGLRYSLASLILLGIIMSRREYRNAARRQGLRWWRQIASYGIVFVAITQGTQFVALALLQAITVSLLLNLTPLIVLALGAIFLREVPSRTQVCLIVLAVVGAMLYFYPAGVPASEILGVAVVIVSLVANAVSSVMGRSINRNRAAPALVVTGISMAFGAILLLAVGFITERTAVLSPLSVVYVVWLSVVNTAFAFTLWNNSMQTLRAVDMSIINCTMMPQIVILSIWFLGEMPSLLDWVGLAVLAISVTLMQVIQAREFARKKG